MKLEINNQKYDIAKKCETEMAVYGVSKDDAGVVTFSKRQNKEACIAILSNKDVPHITYGELQEISKEIQRKENEQ